VISPLSKSNFFYKKKLKAKNNYCEKLVKCVRELLFCLSATIEIGREVNNDDSGIALHRLNMQLDLQSLFGLLCTAVLIG
jgi:hypothetical protein